MCKPGSITVASSSSATTVISPQNHVKQQEQHHTKKESGLPSWQAIVFLIGITCYCLYKAQFAMESIDTVATISTFTNPVFPNIISIQTLGYIRFVMALFVFIVTMELALAPMGFDVVSVYLPGSKLKSTPMPLIGLKALAPFTVWSWMLLGISFLCNAIIPFLVQHYNIDDGDMTITTHANTTITTKWFLRITLIVWEIAAANSILVSLVVTYCLWPILAKDIGDDHVMKRPRCLIMHNINVVFSMTEICLLGGLPVRWDDMYFGPLYGVLYYLFSIHMRNNWTTTKTNIPTSVVTTTTSPTAATNQQGSVVEKEKENEKENDDPGPQFLYLFFDPTLGPVKTIILLFMLLVTMNIGYLLLIGIHEVVDVVSTTYTVDSSGDTQSFAIHTLMVLGVLGMVCKVRD